MKKHSDFQGLEFDWFAVDSDGFVALMSSAGSGPIPDLVFERYEGQCQVHDFLGKLVGLRTTDDWLRFVKLLSAAGIFAYDCRECQPPYQRLTVPPRPRRLEELGIAQDLRDAFVTVPVRFCINAELRPELLLSCTS